MVRKTVITCFYWWLMEASWVYIDFRHCNVRIVVLGNQQSAEQQQTDHISPFCLSRLFVTSLHQPIVEYIYC